MKTSNNIVMYNFFIFPMGKSENFIFQSIPSICQGYSLDIFNYFKSTIHLYDKYIDRVHLVKVYLVIKQKCLSELQIYVIDSQI